MAITIPPRRYFTYSELQERWQCSENDLRYLIVNEQLKPAVKAFKKWTIPDWEHQFDEDEICAEGEIIDAQTGYTLEVQPGGWLYLQMPKQTGPLDCEFKLVSRERDPDKPELPWDVPFASWFWLPNVTTMANVKSESVFLMEEVLKYETTHDKDAVPAHQEKPLTKRERDTLLTIIAALAKEAKINIAQPGKAALCIQDLTDKLGAHVSKRAIEDHLKKIPDALETRKK